jgi:hypothetical protein
MYSLRENSGSLSTSTGLGGPIRGQDCWKSSWGGILRHLRKCSEISFYQYCYGSVIFWYGSGSVDPYLRLTDPDPVIFVSALQDGN